MITNCLINLPASVALLVSEKNAIELEHAGIVHKVVEVFLRRLWYQPKNILKRIFLIAESVMRRDNEFGSRVAFSLVSREQVENLTVGLLVEILGEGIAAQNLEASTQKLDAAVGLEFFEGDKVLAL